MFVIFLGEFDTFYYSGLFVVSLVYEFGVEGLVDDLSGEIGK